MPSRRRISLPGRPTSSAGNAWRERTSAALADAEQFFRKAIDLDPKFALAYVGLSDSLPCRSITAVRRATPTLARAETGSRDGPGARPEPGRGVGIVCAIR